MSDNPEHIDAEEDGFVAELTAQEEAKAQELADSILQQEFEFLNDKDAVHEAAMDVYGGRIFCNLFHLPRSEDQLLPWLVLKIGGLPPETFTAWEKADVYTFWEYTSKASPMGVNGYPQFFSVRLWTRAQVFAIVKELHRLAPNKFDDPAGTVLDPDREVEEG